MRDLLRRLGVLESAIFVYAFWLGVRLLWLRVKSGRKLLVLFRAGGLGDVIATLPAIAALRTQYPDRFLVYCTRREFRGIPEMCPEIGATIGVYHGDTVCRLIQRMYDTRSFIYDDEVPGRVSRKHFAEEMADSVGATPTGGEPHLHVQPLDAPDFRQLTGFPRPTGALIAIHTGPTAPVKEWPHARWQQLVDHLVGLHGMNVIQIGVDHHFLHGSRRSSKLERVLNCRNQVSLLETASLLKSCDLFVGVDSGPLHLAAAVGTPCVGLFGPVDPRLRVSTPTVAVTCPKLPCQFCHHEPLPLHWNTGCPNNTHCMSTLQVDTVLKAALTMLR